jgi:TatD DNase family protein
VPHRGKTNTPALVPLVAHQLAQLRGCTTEEIGQQTTANFHRLFVRTVANALGELT